MSNYGLFDYINSINNKNYIFSDETSKKDYVPYVVNVAFSYFSDTIFIVNEINKYPNVSMQMHYDFMYYAIRKGKRFSKWSKKEKLGEEIKLISDFYQVSPFEAKQYRNILTPEQVEDIRKAYGGRV